MKYGWALLTLAALLVSLLVLERPAHHRSEFQLPTLGAPAPASYLDLTQDLLRPEDPSGWIDARLPRALQPFQRGSPEYDWIARYLSAHEARLPTAVPESEVRRKLTSFHVILVSDIHTCLLHQAAFFALLHMVLQRPGLESDGLVVGLEALSLDSASPDGRLTSSKPTWATSGGSVRIIEKQAARLAALGARFLALAHSTYRERIRSARERSGEPVDVLRIMDEDANEVNRRVCEDIVRARLAWPESRVLVLLGVGHVHAADGGLSHLLTAAKVPHLVVHPYCPELLSLESVRRLSVAGAWIELSEDVLLAPLPRAVAMALGIAPPSEPMTPDK